eukprot:TRINITY_DN2694_c0_g1_i2.p1 TRINITY_DN2694_c0_g1~~TRINITY_DN2694_c0_g1_i2.p1  ORF type:complete len:233 (+),score=40.88 TRINITY_DN2694_c0_g1_i2:273-971(+)
MLGSNNILAVIANHIGESKFLFPLPDVPPQTDYTGIKKEVVQQLQELAQSSLSDLNAKQTPFLSAGLSLALCYINRLMQEKASLKPRILVLQISPDVSATYIAMMNCIFSAQKQGVLIDSCILSATDSPFLQQAAHLTGGIYLRPTRQDALLQYLLSCFLADATTRKFLNLPRLSVVDYRASCFCHKKTIDMGFVCSVCLSIFCTFSPICSTCGAKFELHLPRLAPPKKKIA